jgi:hypothetical protein
VAEPPSDHAARSKLDRFTDTMHPALCDQPGDTAFTPLAFSRYPIAKRPSTAAARPALGRPYTIPSPAPGAAWWPPEPPC